MVVTAAFAMVVAAAFAMVVAAAGGLCMNDLRLVWPAFTPCLPEPALAPLPLLVKLLGRCRPEAAALSLLAAVVRELARVGGWEAVSVGA